MSTRWAFLLALVVSLGMSAPALPNTGDLSGVIEGFVAKQFPNALSHIWVVNGTERQAENEIVLDLNTIVLSRASQVPTESRFLLLIVEGKLAGAQRIPLGATVDCQPESL